MKNPKLLLTSFFQDESGQDLIEYALVAALIGLGSVATLGTLAGDISSAFTSIGTTLTGAV
jgi:pilus assembly protein Flp/PilA